jgi:cell wall assembly regulator SMI1
MAKPRSSAKKPRVVLFTLDDVPVARRLREAIPASDPVRLCAHYAHAQAHKALAAPLHAVPEPDLEAGVAEDILAVDEAVAELFRPDVLLDDDGVLTFGFHPGVDVPRAAKLLAKGGFEVVRYADFMRERLTAESRDEALARATAAFEAAIPSKSVRTTLLAFLRGEATIVPGKALRGAKTSGYTSVNDVCAVALGPAVERWDPEITGRLLDLWVAARAPFELLSFGDGPDELGADRAGMLADALEARGVHPAIALACVPPWRSRSFLATATLPSGAALLAAAAALDASAVEDHERTTRDCAFTLLYVGRPLAESPQVKRLAVALLTSPSLPPGALGARELYQGVKTFGAPFAKKVTRAHLVAAYAHDPRKGSDYLLLLGVDLAKKAPRVHADARQVVNEIWLGGMKELDSNLLEKLAEDSKTIVPEVAWSHLVRLIEGDPKNACVYRGELIPALRKLGAPPADAKKRLAALCTRKAKALGGLLFALSKIAGLKAEPMPYADSDLAGLPAPLAKAWKAAREQSWEAGAKLPKGAAEKALAAVEKVLGVALPEDFRSFYLLHDGGGEWEVRPGHTLSPLRHCLSELDLNKPQIGEDGDPDAKKVKGDFFNARWLPFTSDSGGNSYCLDLDPPKAGTRGQVIFFDHEDEARPVEAKSFLAFLSKVE